MFILSWVDLILARLAPLNDIKECVAGIRPLPWSHAKRTSPKPVVLLSRTNLCISQRFSILCLGVACSCRSLRLFCCHHLPPLTGVGIVACGAEAPVQCDCSLSPPIFVPSCLHTRRRIPSVATMRVFEIMYRFAFPCE